MKSSRKATGKRSFKVFALSVLIFAVWILLLNWLSKSIFGESCFITFIKYGSEISIATSFLALVWEGLEKQKGLLSWHPAEFLSSCLTLIGLYYLVAAANLTGPIGGLKKRATGTVSLIEALWDGFFAIIMNFVVAVLVFDWLLFVAPLFYLLVLVTGAPARRAIRDTGRRVIVKEEEFNTFYKEQASNLKIPEGYKDLSFDAKPFALTNAMNAVVLYLVELLVIGV